MLVPRLYSAVPHRQQWNAGEAEQSHGSWAPLRKVTAGQRQTLFLSSRFPLKCSIVPMTLCVSLVASSHLSAPFSWCCYTYLFITNLITSFSPSLRCHMFYSSYLCHWDEHTNTHWQKRAFERQREAVEALRQQKWRGWIVALVHRPFVV